jgi:FtsP/CotA-like multicopper oxidase with cupredoxin domain
MHSHQSFQEQLLLAAPLIIRGRGHRVDEQEIVIMLHDFSFRSPEEIFAGLRKPGAPAEMTMSGKPAKPMPGMDLSAMPTKPMHGMGMGAMPAMAMDINDVAYDAFLANDRTLEDPEIVRVEPGGQVRQRIINGASASMMTTLQYEGV